MELAVFVCGACVMVLELVGSRLIAPYLGTSLFVWTSLIGVILGCLSAGYWLGGRLADKHPDNKTLARVIFFSGISVIAIALVGDAVLMLVQSTVSDLRVGAVIATLSLFGVPSMLLGMVSPYAVRLKLSHVESSGSTAGRLYALSTVGSIVGTFLAGFFLLSYFNHRSILFLISATLIALGPAVAAGKAVWTKCLLGLLAVLGASLTEPFVQTIMGQDFHEIPTAYNRVWIYDAFLENRPARVLQLNDAGHSAMFIPDDSLALEYTRYFRLGGHFYPHIRRALMIGGGAYSYPKHFLKEFPNAAIDVVEIDPKLTELAKKYFGLAEDPRLHIFHEDARTFLNRTQERYDVVLGDVFKSHSIPFQLTTREAMQKVHGCLTEEGVFLINVISSVNGAEGRLLRAILATLDELFPQIYVFAVQKPENGENTQNLIIAAFKTKQKRKLYSEDSEVNRYLTHVWAREIPRDMPVLTDSFAPIEKYAARLMDHNNSARRNGIMQKKLQSKNHGPFRKS
jgi:spermidine synthase